MSSRNRQNGCDVTERLVEYALGMLPPDEAAGVRRHIDGCAECRMEMQRLDPLVDSVVHWPTDVVRSSTPLWDRISERLGNAAAPEPPASGWVEPDWEDAAPGISCKLLATDRERHRVSMLVRLAPDTAYPPHRHAGVEELFLLDGELMIGERKLSPGDYNYGEAGALDSFVYSETGCTCVLVTSTKDEIC